MIVAVPLFGQEVAPRFGFAESFLVAEIENEQVVRADLIATEFRGWVNRLSELRNLGVEVILCGGFNRAFLPLAEDLGIHVMAGLAGDAHRAVEAFSRGDAQPTLPNAATGCRGVGESGDPAHGIARGRGMGGCRRRGATSNGRRVRGDGRRRRAHRGNGGDKQPT